MPGAAPGAVAPTTYYHRTVHAIAPFAVRGLILKMLQQNQYDQRYSDKAEALIRGLRIVMNSPQAPAAFFQFRPPMYWEEGEPVRPAAETPLGGFELAGFTASSFNTHP